MKTILLTGAGGGIGSATKAALEATGATVIGVERRDADLSSAEATRALATRVARGAQLDWLVFAHGFLSAETEFERQSIEEIKTTFDLNILSIVYLTQLLLPLLKPGGGVVFVSSAAGLRPNGRYAAYSASKAAVNAFSQALARNKPTLNFISVCPGPTNTPLRERVAHDAAKHQNPAAVARVIAAIVSGSGGYQSGDVVVVEGGKASIAARM